MNIDNEILVKYCFSEAKYGIPENKETYYSSIIAELEIEGIIQDLHKYEYQDPFSNNDKEFISYQIEPFEKYVYSFSCLENRQSIIYRFDFMIKFAFETHDVAHILYIEICSNNYTFIENDGNCLEILKHKLRSKIRDWKNRYCLIDKQSAFYASNLYPQIYEIENYFRFYVNDVFIKVFGANWWNEVIAANIRKSHEKNIEDTREYAGAYKDIQPYLLSLELNELMEIAKTKKLKWNPVYNLKIENVLNHYSEADVISLLKEQCVTKIDLWSMCFSKHLSNDFTSNYTLFEKRRNQVAHNKMLDFETYKNISELCNKIIEELVTAHTKFCRENISREEQEMIQEYKEYLSEQEEIEREALKAIAEEESGVKVLSEAKIADLFNDTLNNLYFELENIFANRNDLEFSLYKEIKNIEGSQQCFIIKYNIKDLFIYINAKLDINDSPGEVSTLKIVCSLDDQQVESKINFNNGEYSFFSEQTNYMPEKIDELDKSSIDETKKTLCNFVEDHFPNLREEADMKNYLEAMGKELSIVEKEVYCWDCGEEYICINDEYAPIGTCLNCGAKNYIIYCTYCQCPIEAVNIKEKGSEQYYCSNCNGKLFGPD